MGSNRCELTSVDLHSKKSTHVKPTWRGVAFLMLAANSVKFIDGIWFIDNYGHMYIVE
jgi:hypothetical protein